MCARCSRSIVTEPEALLRAVELTSGCSYATIVPGTCSARLVGQVTRASRAVTWREASAVGGKAKMELRGVRNLWVCDGGKAGRFVRGRWSHQEAGTGMRERAHYLTSSLHPASVLYIPHPFRVQTGAERLLIIWPSIPGAQTLRLFPFRALQGSRLVAGPVVLDLRASRWSRTPSLLGSPAQLVF